VSAVEINHVFHANRPIVENGPVIRARNANGKVATTNVDLPVSVASGATAEFNVGIPINDRKRIESLNVVPKFDVRTELGTRAVQLICALQRGFI
jgi:hypothetical protein